MVLTMTGVRAKAADLVRRRESRLNVVASALAALAGVFALGGWLIGTRLLIVPLLAVSTLSVLRARPGRLAWIVHGRDAGAFALRRTLPAVLLGLPAITIIHAEGEQHYWHSECVAETFYVAVVVPLVCALLFGVASSLRVVDEQRENARHELLEINVRLSEQIRDHQDALWFAEHRIGALESSQRAAVSAHDDVLQAIFASGMVLKSRLGVAGECPEDPSVQSSLDCMDEALKAIRRVVVDLNDQLGPPAVT